MIVGTAGHIDHGCMEGKRSWWDGRASNPVGGAMRRRVGSTPIPFRRNVWARLESDGTATVGITSLGIKLSGEMERPE